MQRISSKPSLLDLIFRQNYPARYGLLEAASHITIFIGLHLFFLIFGLETPQPEIHAWNQLQRISSKPSLLDLIFRQNYRACYGLLATGSGVSYPNCISLLIFTFANF